jgi:hypothetical protein
MLIRIGCLRISKVYASGQAWVFLGLAFITVDERKIGMIGYKGMLKRLKECKAISVSNG